MSLAAGTPPGQRDGLHIHINGTQYATHGRLCLSFDETEIPVYELFVLCMSSLPCGVESGEYNAMSIVFPL